MWCRFGPNSRWVGRWSGTIPALAMIAFVGWLIAPAMVDAGAWVLSGTQWTDRDEQTYSEFVRALGESGAGSLNKFVRNPQLNPLYSEEDKKFNLLPDCADFPYVVRAYVAYKLRLPFGWVSSISGGGGDERYSDRNKPRNFASHDSYQTPQGVFGHVTLVNSGYFRMSPEVESSDTYPVKIQRASIVPGTIYYDPNGHVALVYQVTEDGRIRMIDGHPDKSVSRPWFGSKFARGSARNGGGFRRWRPMYYSADGAMRRAGNLAIPDFSAADQYQRAYDFGTLGGLGYFEYVRVKLSSSGGLIKPLEEFGIMMDDIYEDVKYRAEAVSIAVQKGLSRKEHPGFLPWNIYGTDGEWEEYSTPSRDARLKVAFAEFFNKTVQMIGLAERRDSRLQYGGSPGQLAQELLAIFDEKSPQLTITYQNSLGHPVVLSFHDVIRRLFDFSFDPYHSPELRWGARGQELLTAKDGASKRKFYEQERRLRNQLERLYNCQTALAMGPEQAIDVDVRKWLVDYLGGQRGAGAMIALGPACFGGPGPNVPQTGQAALPPEAPSIAGETAQDAGLPGVQPVAAPSVMTVNPNGGAPIMRGNQGAPVVSVQAPIANVQAAARTPLRVAGDTGAMKSALDRVADRSLDALERLMVDLHELARPAAQVKAPATFETFDAAGME